MGFFSGQVTIDLGAIQENYKILDSLSSSACETGACVKADAYGLGVSSVAPALYEAGNRRFFVATISEAVAVRNVLKDAYVYIFNGFSYAAKEKYKEHGFIPVLNSLKEIEVYQKFAREEGENLPAILHFDTGMNRLGMRAQEAKTLCDDLTRADGIDIHYIMSHFACADEKDHPQNQAQMEAFGNLALSFPHVKKSLCNSAGILLSKDYHFDLTRPGIALYGGRPVMEMDNPMRQVVSLSAPVLQVYGVQKGDNVGYNGTYRFNDNGAVAIVSIGYADGFLRSLSDSGSLYWKGYQMPIRGRVSMDLVICDLVNVPENEYPTHGDGAEVIGKSQSIDDLGADAQTISYEILTSLGSRYHRSYI